MTVKKRFEKMPLAVLILTSIIVFGCSKNSESDAAKTDKTSQSPTVSNNSANQASTASNNNTNQAPMASNINNVSANPPNTASPIVNKRSSPPVKEPTPNIGSGAGDMYLFTQVRSALSSDEALINAVIVEIKEGNATLSGNVLSEARKTKAAQLVQSVAGIKSVKNNLRVSP